MSQPNPQLMEKGMEVEKESIEMGKEANSLQYLEHINTLAAGIAHEIRNPLTTVKGFLQLLRPYLYEIGKEQYADIAIDELNRANDLIFEFLNATKPQMNKKEIVSINKLIKDIGLLYESEALLHNIVLNITLADSNPAVLAGGLQLKQVFINILKNSIDAIIANSDPISGQINLLVKEEDHSVCIIMDDNGCGMTEETLNNLFMPFYTTKKTGTGIGLPICKKIIEEHSGQILISSIQGKGSTFKILLPLHIAD